MYFKPLKLKENAPDFLWLHEGGYALGVPEQAEKIAKMKNHAIEHHFAEQNIIIEYIKGGRTVTKLVNFQINEFPQMRIIGKAIYPNLKMEGNPIPEGSEIIQGRLIGGCIEVLEMMKGTSDVFTLWCIG